MEGQELAERHIDLRERAGLTQEQEAKMAGVSPTTISGIESGKIARPHLKTLLKIARALGTDVGELRGPGKAEAPPSQRSLFNGGEEERRRLRVQLLRELKEHAASLASRYRQDLAQLTARRGSSAEWERLERESAFASIGTHYLLQDESGAPEGLQSEPERRVWRAAHKAGQDLDAVCNDIEAAAASAREVAGLKESEGLRALDAYRSRAS